MRTAALDATRTSSMGLRQKANCCRGMRDKATISGFSSAAVLAGPPPVAA